MLELLREQRKPPILTPSSIPCLARSATVNVTRGCAVGCVYCYAQAYRHYPGRGRVVLYENMPEVLACELRRKRRWPQAVCFSPSSDPFQPIPEVQRVTFESMRVLLRAGISISFLTKGLFGDQFLELWAGDPGLVRGQIGLTSLDEPLCRRIEPHAARPAKRLEAIRRLNAMGVKTTARLDPLIPGLTDTAPNLSPLLAGLRAAGVERVAASFMFIRPRFARRLAEALAPWGIGRDRFRSWPVQDFGDGCAPGRTLPFAERAARLARVVQLGARFGIRIVPCHCKNRGIASEPCIAMSRPGRQLELFERAG